MRGDGTGGGVGAYTDLIEGLVLAPSQKVFQGGIIEAKRRGGWNNTMKGGERVGGRDNDYNCDYHHRHPL